MDLCRRISAHIIVVCKIKIVIGRFAVLEITKRFL